MILLSTQVEMSINTKEMNKPRLSGDTNITNEGKSTSSRKVNFEVDEYLNNLI